MAWQIEFDRRAEKELSKLQPAVAARLLRFLNDRVAELDNPRAIGEALKGAKLGDLWKYRVGDYRIIASIEDRRLVILVLRIADRKDVYR
jgi:mRNA interferase RelE/StbE